MWESMFLVEPALLPWAVESHLGALAQTEECRELLWFVSKKALEVRRRGDVMVLAFRDAEGGELLLECEPPLTDEEPVESELPVRLQGLLYLHRDFAFGREGQTTTLSALVEEHGAGGLGEFLEKLGLRVLGTW